MAGTEMNVDVDLNSIFASAKTAAATHKEAERKVKEAVDAYHRQKSEEFNLRTLSQVMYDAEKVANQQVAEIITAEAQAIWNGERGKGVLVVLMYDWYTHDFSHLEVLEASSGEVRFIFARLLDLTEDQQLAKALEEHPFLRLDCGRWHRDSDYIYILSPDEKIVNQFLPSLYHVERGDWQAPRLAWVECGEVTTDEALAIYRKIDKERLTPAQWVQLFGEKILDEMESGETFYVLGCSHHSGDINVSLMKLPTNRWAVIVSYSGGSGESCSCNGVLESPLVEVDTSAKNQEVNLSTEAQEPTSEELEFIKSRVELYSRHEEWVDDGSDEE